ncbi:MAG TPA: hypothetical protein VFU74_21685 [Actinocrinis sp.]|nr:hypothetical protein [Actinocrinis sp.]
MPVITKREARDAAEGVGLAFVGTVVVIVLALIIGVGLWAFGVFTSGAKGAGDERKQQNSVTNRVHWQNEFNSLDQNIATYAAQIANARASATAHPGDTFYEQNLTGLVQECDIAVGQYNADAAMPIAAPWLPAGLPTTIDRTATCGS